MEAKKSKMRYPPNNKNVNYVFNIDNLEILCYNWVKSIDQLQKNRC